MDGPNGPFDIERMAPAVKGRNRGFQASHPSLHRAPWLWQVAVDSGFRRQPVVHYFLIRARPPYRFTMVEESGRPWPDCTVADTAFDNAPVFFDKLGGPTG